MIDFNFGLIGIARSLAVLLQSDGSGAVIEEALLQMDQNLNSFEFWIDDVTNKEHTYCANNYVS